eukprot:5254147-Amphidinium_carterae.1
MPGDDPTYDPLVQKARYAVAGAICLDAEKSDLHHPYTPWKGHLLAEMAKLGQDDTIAASWLLDGAPIGIARPIPAGGLFPRCVQEKEREEEDLDQSRVHNHPSFYQTFGEEDAPGQEQIAIMLSKGFVELFPDR